MTLQSILKWPKQLKGRESEIWTVGRAYQYRKNFEFQPLLFAREISSLLVVLPWCKVLADWTCLCCNSWKANDTIEIKLYRHDKRNTNSTLAYAHDTMTSICVCMRHILISEACEAVQKWLHIKLRNLLGRNTKACGPIDQVN